jgi:hypothetical protein
MACGDSQRYQARWYCGGVAVSREIEMKKLALALLLFTAPALAQTPNLAGAPPASNVESPVVCLPIGKTSKGDLVYAMECRDIPVEKTAMPPLSSTAPSTAPTAAPSSAPPAAPESK